MHSIDLLRLGVTIWNSQRPKLDIQELEEEYRQYVEREADLEKGEPYGYEHLIVSFENYVFRRAPQGLDLSKADLREMDLRGYDLTWCRLQEAKLNAADLRGANLAYANLHDTNLIGADLRGANLTKAWLQTPWVCGMLVEKESLAAAQGAIQSGLTGAFTGLESLSLDAWGTIVHFYQRRCAYCGGPYEIIDHFLPLSQGGRTWVGNVVPACFACWSAKGEHRRPDDKVIPREVMQRVVSELQRRARAARH